MRAPILGKVVCTVRTTIKPEFAEEFVRWQMEEHIPGLLKVPGYRGIQMCRSTVDPYSTMNVWEMDSTAAFTSEEHDRASHTPWRIRIIPMRSVFDVELFDHLTHDSLFAGPDSNDELLSHIKTYQLKSIATPDEAIRAAAKLAERTDSRGVRVLRGQQDRSSFLIIQYFAGPAGDDSRDRSPVNSVATEFRIVQGY